MRFRRRTEPDPPISPKDMKRKRRPTETTISGLDQMEKRIGRRQQIPKVPVRWCTEKGPCPTEAEVQADPSGHIVELSASGAGIIGPLHKEIEVDAPIHIACLGMRSEVVIKRVDPDYSPYHAWYGVEFAEPGAPLTRSLYGHFQARASAGPTEYRPVN